MLAVTDFGIKIQTLMDEAYGEWQKEENKHREKWDILDGFPASHQIAVAFGNFNYQVENGGIEQWIYNGYFNDDAEKLTEYLKIGAQTDERCSTILDMIYTLDQYARETDCDRNGNFRDEDGEDSFIGDIINHNEFDTWYYRHCGKDDWWEVVCGIIDKAEAHGLAQTGQQEHNESDIHMKPTLEVFIGNVHDERIGGFTIPLPTPMETMQPFLDSVEITGWQDIEILEVMSDIGGLSEILSENVRRTMSQDALDELNYLASRIGVLRDSNGYDIFAAAVAAKRHSGSIAEIINLTFDENLNCFDVLPVYNKSAYGDFLVNMAGQDEHAGAFNRLKASEDPADKVLAAYIEKLEKYIDHEAFGRTAMEEENGVFTKHGYLTGGEGFQELYKGPRDIPDEYRLFTGPGEIGKLPMKLDGVDIAATIMKLSAVCTDNTRSAADNLKTLLEGKSRDYLLVVNQNDVCLSPAIDAYKRGMETSAFILQSAQSETEQPDVKIYAVRVAERGDNSATGDFVELNGKALHENITRFAATPDRIDAIFINGESDSYDLWAWADMPSSTRESIKIYSVDHPESALAEAARRCELFMGANEKFSEAVDMEDFLIKAGAAYMTAAEYSQPDMIRIAKEAGIEILARGDADVYRLFLTGVKKLLPIEATRLANYTGSCELAIKREDLDGLDKWARRAAENAARQNERGKQDKSKAEELQGTY